MNLDSQNGKGTLAAALTARPQIESAPALSLNPPGISRFNTGGPRNNTSSTDSLGNVIFTQNAASTTDKI